MYRDLDTHDVTLKLSLDEVDYLVEIISRARRYRVEECEILNRSEDHDLKFQFLDELARTLNKSYLDILYDPMPF